MPDPTDPQTGNEWFNTKPYHTRSKDKQLLEIDEALTDIFTDTGIAVGASIPFLFGSELNHFSFAESGQLHTIHILGNEASTADAGVYIPQEFDDFTVTSTDTVVAKNPDTGRVILIAHVKVGDLKKTVKENAKTKRDNGTMYIGDIGGRDGEGVPEQNGRGKHSHLTFFPSEEARLAATRSKSKRQRENPIADYIVSDAPNLDDFRTLVKSED